MQEKKMEKTNTKRKSKTGVVLRNTMDKTAVVEVARTVMDYEYKKYIRRKRKFMVHDEKNECKVGDVVEIEECRPLSKRKSWRLTRILEHAKLPEEVVVDEQLETAKRQSVKSIPEV
jgi:small subunit ribosomal protein S17